VDCVRMYPGSGGEVDVWWRRGGREVSLVRVGGGHCEDDMVRRRKE